MSLDTPTIFLCITIAGFAGSVILLAFRKIWNTRSRACSQSLLLWSAGLFLTGCGTALIGLRGSVPNELSIILANFLIVLGTGLRRGGFAAFLGRPKRLNLFAVIALLWAGLCIYPPFMDSFISRVNFVQSFLIASSLWVAWMAFTQNPEKLKSAKLLGLTNLVECAAYVGFIIHQNLYLYPSFLAVFPQDFTVIYLLTILASIIMTMVLPACMVVERASQRFREQALKDTVTGLSNRRAVLNEAEDWIAAQNETQGKVAYTLVLFELGGFKSVGDRFGTAMSDAVLQLFGRVLTETLEGSSMVGRIEGEVFVAILPRANRDVSFLTTQKLIKKFGSMSGEASDGKLDVFVNAGVISATTSSPLERVVDAAYRGVSSARRKGRGHIVALELASDGNLRKTLATGEFAALKRKAA